MSNNTKTTPDAPALTMDQAASSPKVKLEVRSKGPNGFRRGGRYWGPDPVEVELESEQADAVMREGNLFVRRLDGGALPDRELRAGAAPTQPMFSGLEDGLKPVPSDKNAGEPTDEQKAKAAKASRTNEPSKTGGELTPEQKAEQDRLQAEQKNRR